MPTEAWREFDAENDGDRVNEQKVWALLLPNHKSNINDNAASAQEEEERGRKELLLQATAERIQSVLQECFNSMLFGGTNNNETTVSASSSGVGGDKKKKENEEEELLSKLVDMEQTPRYQLSSPENMEAFEDCTAVRGISCPTLTLIDMPNEACYCLPLVSINDAKKSDGLPNLAGIDCNQRIREFVLSVVRGTAVKSLQGAAPPVGNRPAEDLLLSEDAVCVVQSTLEDLIYKCNDSNVALVLWSERCPCCPEVVRMVNMITSTIQRKIFDVAFGMGRCDGDESSATTSTTTNGNNNNNNGVEGGGVSCPLATSCVGSASASTCPLLRDPSSDNCSLSSRQQQGASSPCCYCPRIKFCICNVTENDLAEPDWPAAEIDRVVPMFRFYQVQELINARMEHRPPVSERFSEKRSVESIVRFILRRLGCEWKDRLSGADVDEVIRDASSFLNTKKGERVPPAVCKTRCRERE